MVRSEFVLHNVLQAIVGLLIRASCLIRDIMGMVNGALPLLWSSRLLNTCSRCW